MPITVDRHSEKQVHVSVSELVKEREAGGLVLAFLLTAKDVGFTPWTLKLHADGVKLSGTVQQSAIRRARGMRTDQT
jgi:hypothetical protein